MSVEEITSEADFNQTLEDFDTVVCHFFAAWSAVDKATAPKFATLADDFTNGGTTTGASARGTSQTHKFIRVDVDEVPEVAETWSVNCMPTFIVYRVGQMATKVEGADLDRLRLAIHAAGDVE